MSTRVKPLENWSENENLLKVSLISVAILQKKKKKEDFVTRSLLP